MDQNNIQGKCKETINDIQFDFRKGTAILYMQVLMQRRRYIYVECD